MKHSHTRIWIHLIWATKKRERYLFKEASKKLYKHLIEKAIDLGIPFERLNIQLEHVHGLINLPTDKCLADVVQNLKGESSHWINENNLVKGEFSWQRGYGGFSVSVSQFERVKQYIENQSDHHRYKSFDEEYEEWKRMYGIDYD